MKSPFDKQTVFIHSGHIGDIIAFLPSYQKLNGTHIAVIDDPSMAPMSGFKYGSLKPLLESQGIEVSLNTPPSIIDFDVRDWRSVYQHHVSLLDVQAQYLGLCPRWTGRLDHSGPWITVDPDPETKGRVILNRTPRYRNPKFKWEKIHKHFGSRALFVGTDAEYDEYTELFGNVERLIADDCLTIAKAIAGADFFVGNQSSACWIAMALNKPLIQEGFPEIPNSVVKYQGAQFSFDGKFELP